MTDRVGPMNSRRLMKGLGYLPDDDTEQAEQPEQEQQDTPPDPLANDRARACRDNGLPQAMAPRLQGSTAAGVTADAMRLARELKQELTQLPPNAAENEAVKSRKQSNDRETQSLLPGQAWSEGKEHR